MAVSAKTVSNTAPVETPSAKVVRDGNKLRNVVDKLGRNITYKKMGVLEEARMARSLGSEISSNTEYMKYVRMAYAVQSIDNDPGTAPTKISFIEMRIDWIGDEGFLAVWTDQVAEMRRESGLEDEDDEESEPSVRTDGLTPEAAELKN